MFAERDSIFVKTCGLRSRDVVETAIGAGADAIGFMLAPSKRQVTIADVRDMRQGLVAKSGQIPAYVAVTVNATDEELDAIASSELFDIIQLSGDEEPAMLSQIPSSLAVWKAFRPTPDASVDEVLRSVSAWLDGTVSADRVMLDAYHANSYGGSGVVGNWSVASAVAKSYPIILAGGLRPDNVADAIIQVAPFGVDVSSGIETDGVKDPAKIAAFVDAACKASALSANAG